MRCDLFTDPRYHAETHIELDPTQVFSTAEKTVKLFMGGAHRVTEVTLQSGEVLLVKGEIARRIEAARIEAARIEAARIEAARIEAARIEAARRKT